VDGIEHAAELVDEMRHGVDVVVVVDQECGQVSIGFDATLSPPAVTAAG